MTREAGEGRPALPRPCAIRHSLGSWTRTTTEEDGMRNPKSIELLNKAVADELSAVHQYM